MTHTGIMIKVLVLALGGLFCTGFGPIVSSSAGAGIPLESDAPSPAAMAVSQAARRPRIMTPAASAPGPDRLLAQLEQDAAPQTAAETLEQPQPIVPLEVPPPPAGTSTQSGLTARGYTGRYFHLARPRVGLGLSYEFEEVQRHASGDDTKDTSNEFRERLPIEASGWAYHPALCKFTLGFVPEWSQTKRELDPGPSESDQVFVPSYALDAVFLEPKPYTLHAFADRRELKLRSAFSEPTDTTIETYGGDLRLKYYKVLPTFFKYTHTDTDQSGFYDTNGKRDDFNLTSQRVTKNSTTTLNSLYSDDKRTGDGETVRVKNYDGNLGNEYYIGGDQRKTLYSKLGYRWTDNESQKTNDYSIQEELFWRYTENLYTDYIFSYGKRDTDDFDSETTALRGKLQHLLYENLTTTFSAGAVRNDFTGGEENTYDGDLSLLYQRSIPWGVLNLTGAWNYSYTTREGSETLIQVTDEPHILITGEVTLLDNENVQLDSITVTDVTGTIGYIENVDYTIAEVNSFVRISRTTTGDVANGQTVLVDYVFLSEPAFDDTVFNQNYGIQFYLWNALTLSYRYQHAHQDIVSGPSPENTLDDTAQAAEIRYDLGWTDTRLAAEDSDRSNGTSTRSWLASQTFRMRPARRVSLDITGSFTRTKFTDVGQTQKNYGASARLLWTPVGWCRFRMQGFYNKITGDVDDQIDANLFAGFDLSYRIWRGNIGYYYDRAGTSDTYRNRNAVVVEVTRILW